MLSGPSLIPDNPKNAVVLMHGFGSNGEDLISLAPYLKAALPNTAFFAPNAPDFTAFGEGYQWFSDNDWTFVDREGIERAKNLLEKYIERTVVGDNNLSFDKVAIASFSQGTMTALFSAPRMAENIAGLVAYSGRMMWDEELEDTEFNTFPIRFIHGREDDVVDFQGSVLAEEKLNDLGFDDTDCHIVEGLAHGIDERGIALAIQFLVEKCKFA